MHHLQPAVQRARPRRGYGSVSSELRALTQALLQQLRADYEAAAALCRKMGKQSCKELRKAKRVCLPGLSVAELATLASLASVLPALETLFLTESSDTPSGSVLPALENLHLYVPAAGPDGVHRLVEGMGAAALPSLTLLNLSGMHVNDAGALALSAALGRGAMPRLKFLDLTHAGIGGAGLVALAPALRRRPALEYLSLRLNPLSDEGIAALVTPPPPTDALPPPTGGLANLQTLDLCGTDVADAGCAALAAALDSGVLPVLKELLLYHAPASAAAKHAVVTALLLKP